MLPSVEFSGLYCALREPCLQKVLSENEKANIAPQITVLAVQPDLLNAVMFSFAIFSL